MHPVLIAILVYFVLCGLTAWVLSQTPYQGNGLLLNFVFAPAYWYAAIRGRL